MVSGEGAIAWPDRVELAWAYARNKSGRNCVPRRSKHPGRDRFYSAAMSAQRQNPARQRALGLCPAGQKIGQAGRCSALRRLHLGSWPYPPHPASLRPKLRPARQLDSLAAESAGQPPLALQIG